MTGVGSARPARFVSGAELVRPFGKDAAWLLERTGIESLRRLDDAQTLLELAVASGRAAFADARALSADVVIVASCSGEAGPQQPLAEQVAAQISPGAVGVDLNAACAGFVYALSSAADLVRSASAQSVLVIGAEQMSRLVDPADLGTSILFADGAGAVLVSSCHPGEDAFAPPAYYSDGASREVLMVPPGSSTLIMDGQAVFRWAVNTVPEVMESALRRAGVEASEIEVFLPHQANARITAAIRRRVGLEHAITADDVRCSGNTSAASIPLALAALRGHTDVSGKLALVAGFGAGLACAAQVLRLP